MTYPTSPAEIPETGRIAGAKKPISSISASVPACMATIGSPLRNSPSNIRRYAITPRYWSNSESKISARGGASGSPSGAGIRATTASSTSRTPSPVFAEIRSTSSGAQPIRSTISPITRSGSAPGRSTLFSTGTSSSPASTAA